MTKDPAKSRALALRALRDVEVVRVTLGAVPPGYIQLQREGLVTAKRVPGTNKADVRLKEKP